MPDREKVIKGLDCCRQMCMDYEIEWCPSDCPYRDDGECIQTLCADALALLREQEKTKVVFRQYDGSVESECGNCGLYLDKTYSVCPKCGKELDWNA